jgi:HPt (histidine-containing phosphotransfer) domain-containing protein
MEPDVIDLTRTAALGDPSTEAGRGALAEIFRLYFENAAAACADMRHAGSPDDVRRHAHRAKGASGIVGAAGMSRLFADVEARAAAGETIGTDTFDDLERRLAALRLAAAMQLGVDLK